MFVSITELRANLSSVLEAVDRGTTVTITDGGRERAVLKPAGPTEQQVIEQGIREGWLSVGHRFYDKREDRRPLNTVKSRPGVRVEDILAEERDN